MPFRAPKAARDPLARVRSQNSLLNLFSDYLPLSVHVVSSAEPGTWFALVPPPGGLHPVQFEVYFGALKKRYAYHAAAVKQAARLGRPLQAEHLGLWDCLAAGDGGACVMAGAYLRALPTPAELKRRFSAMARGKEASADLFQAYARAVLETPLLSPAAAGALEQACAMAAVMSLGASPGDAAALEQLKPLLARECSSRMERFAAARRERLLWWAAQASGLADWDRRDFDIDEMPGAVLAFSPLEQAGDAVEDLHRLARLRQEAFSLAVQRGYVAGRASGEGACLLLPLKALGKRGALEPALLRAAGEARSTLSKRLGAEVAVGLSRPLGGEGLPEAFREAEWSLLMALQRGERQLAYTGLGLSEGSSIAAFESTRVLKQAVLQGPASELAAATDNALAGLTRLFPGRADLLRAPLVHLSLEVFDALRRRALLEGAQWEGLRREAVGSLEAAASARELAAAFTLTCARLGQLARSPRGGAARLRLSTASRALDPLGSPPLLKEAAQGAAVSASRFSRLFKQEQGEGFGLFRRRRRLRRAAELLKQGSLPIWRVAQECGYRSPSHFGKAFLALYGKLPSAYRRSERLANKRHK